MKQVDFQPAFFISKKMGFIKQMFLTAAYSFPKFVL